MRVLAAHAAELAKATAAEAAERPPDAYDVLGVEHDAPAGGCLAAGPACASGPAVGGGEPGVIALPRWLPDGPAVQMLL